MHSHKSVRGAAYPVPRRPLTPRVITVRKTAIHTRAVQETSAGGLCIDVRDGVAYVALIMRRNRGGRLEWCLPKGHLEGRETPAQAAVREVQEETGARGRVVCKLGTVDYWFSGTSTRIHKLVHHFLLEYLDGELTVENDPDQEAEDTEWVPLLEAQNRLSYPNERRVVAAAIDLLYSPSPNK